MSIFSYIKKNPCKPIIVVFWFHDVVSWIPMASYRPKCTWPNTTALQVFLPERGAFCLIHVFKHDSDSILLWIIRNMDFRFQKSYKQLEEDFSEENQNTIQKIISGKNNMNNSKLPNYKQAWRNANARGTRKSALRGPNDRPLVQLNEGGPENNNSPAPGQMVGFDNFKTENISREEYNRNQQWTRNNRMRRNPKYNELVANLGRTMRVSRVVPSQVEETHAKSNYERVMPNSNYYPHNKKVFNRMSRRAMRPNVILPRTVPQLTRRGYKLNNVKNAYKRNISRSEYISYMYAAALQGRTPETAIRALEDKKQTTRNNTKKRNIQTAINRIKRNFPANAEY